MKKISKLAFLFIALFGLSASSFASFDWLSAQPLVKNTAPALFTLTMSTTSGKSFKAFMQMRDFVGRSKTAPCSDMKKNVDLMMQQEIKPGVYPISSDDLKFWPGPNFTCYRFEIVYDGVTYSSGNVQLGWDEANKVYTDANPKEFQFNFNH